MRTDERLSGLDYFKRCMTSRYAEFSGRARRAEYWYFRLFEYIGLFAVAILGALLIALTESEGSEMVLMFALVVGYLGLIIPGLAVSVRRLHDTNRSGLWLLISFVPLIGGIVLLVFFCTEGTRGPNQYGPDPKDLSAAANDPLARHFGTDVAH